MPKLIVQNLFDKEVYVAAGQKVLTAIQQAGIDWMQACGAKGRCTTCRIIVGQGMPGFGPLSETEEKYRAQNRLQENERLTCQCFLNDDASGRVPEQTKFPHMTYSE
jgi:2Fe-2S ferredoxin